MGDYFEKRKRCDSCRGPLRGQLCLEDEGYFFNQDEYVRKGCTTAICVHCAMDPQKGLGGLDCPYRFYRFEKQPPGREKRQEHLEELDQIMGTGKYQKGDLLPEEGFMERHAGLIVLGILATVIFLLVLGNLL